MGLVHVRHLHTYALAFLPIVTGRYLVLQKPPIGPHVAIVAPPRTQRARAMLQH
jgi:hypothetical protein